MEHLALALNPAQGLVGGTRLIDLIRAEGMTEVLAAFDELLAEQEYAFYEVRRILRPRMADPTKLGNAARSLRIRTRGPRTLLQGTLDRLAAQGEEQRKVKSIVGEDKIMRLYQYQRGATFPAVERFFVVAPALALAKEADNFDTWWAEALAVSEGVKVAS